MGFVAAFLLLYLSEEEVFWMLVMLTDHYLEPDFFTADMLGLHTEIAVFEDLLKAKLPKGTSFFLFLFLCFLSVSLN